MVLINLTNISGRDVKILNIPYKGRWVVWKRPKTPLRNIKMVPYLSLGELIQCARVSKRLNRICKDKSLSCANPIMVMGRSLAKEGGRLCP